MMHAFIRAARPFFGGRYGEVPDGPVTPAELCVEASGLHFQVLRWPGEGTPVVLLHGLVNSAWVWARVGQLLSAQGPVIALSMRGHGTSSTPAAGYSLEETTADLHAVLGALAIDACHLGGHSWGGKVATHFATEHPDQVQSLLLADPVMPGGYNPLLEWFPGLVSAAFTPERKVFPNRAAMQAGARSLAYLAGDDEVDWRLWAEKFVARADGSFAPVLPDGAFREILGPTLRTDLRPRLARIQCPVLLLRPTFTVSFLPWEVRALRAALPALTARRVSGDHTFIHANALDTAAVLASFLDNHFGTWSTARP